MLCALLFSRIFKKGSDKIYAKMEPMEKARRIQKKKDHSYDFPSCFLSPESPGDHKFGRYTPNFDAPSSSCFLTPPSSSEKVVNSTTRLDSLQDLTKLNFELDDGDRELSKQKSSQRAPLHPEDRIIGRRFIDKQRLDIISELLAYGCTSICEKICSYLKPQDLHRFGCVSSTWRSFVKENCHEGKRYREYIKECKEVFTERGKENRGTPHFQNPTFGHARFPLKEINNRPQRQHQNQKCMPDTQQHVQSGETNGLSTALEKRLAPQKSGNDIIGSKKIKARLKRL